MTAIILAGGKSSRMGNGDKAFLEISGVSIIKRQLMLLKKYFREIIIVTNSPHKYKGLKGAKIISDIALNQGPLGGIFSGLSSSQDNYNFVFACDMPFINTRLIKYMRINSAGYDVVVPRINDKYEPLFCIYSKSCVRFIKPLLDKKIFKISRFFPKVKVREVAQEEVLRFGRPENIFMNVNTPDDVNKLQGLTFRW